MKLSVITINYNDCDGLKKTIDSVVSQTFKDFEWIVIDGGSTDGSRDLIERFADCFAYWVSEPDTGVYNAMNKGIKVAKGEYIQFLNSGDWLYDETVLERVYSRNDKEDIIFANKHVFYYQDGTTSVCEREYGNYFTPFNLIHQNINHQSAFIKKELFEKYGYYDETYSIIADRKFFFETILLHDASTAMLDFIIVYFGAEGLSSTIDSSKEKERLLCEYLPKQSVDDYYEWLSRKGYINDHQHEIDVYSVLRKHKLLRKVMHFFYKCYKR